MNAPPCLYFHHVVEGFDHYTNYPPRKFRELAAYIAEHYVTLTPARIVRLVACGAEVPDNAILLTFDDAYRNNLDGVVPVLLDYGLSATFFAISGFLGRRATWNQSGGARYEHMTASDLRTLVELGFEVGSHTVDHIPLASLQRGALKRQLQQSKAALEHELGRPVTSFAYPYGVWDEAAAQEVALHFDVGFSTVKSRSTAWDGPRSSLARAYIDRDRPIEELDAICRSYREGRPC